MSFKRDLGVGSIGESFIQSVFAKHNIATQVNTDRAKLSEYDIEIFFEEKSVMIEAKFDLYCARSGNIAIEFFNPKLGRPSGIGHTKADLWIHVISQPMSVWVTSVTKLKQFITSNKPHRVITCGGDDNSSMYLYKKDIIFDTIFKRIDECDTETFVKLLKENLC